VVNLGALDMGRKDSQAAMRRKIAPSNRLKEELRSYLRDAGEAGEGANGLSELVRLATALITQEGLEAEQRDFIGRDRYERGERRGWTSPGLVDTGFKPLSS
jgi:hypothetical protein